MVHKLIERIPTPGRASEIYAELTKNGHSRRPRMGSQYVRFKMSRALWDQFAGQFDNFAGDGHHRPVKPAFLAFSYLLADLSEGELTRTVQAAFAKIPELAEVVEWAPALPSPSYY